MNSLDYNPSRPTIRLPFWLVLALLLPACGDQTIDVRAPAPELRPTSLMPISVAEDAPVDSLLRTLKILNAERYTSEGLSFQFAPGADSTPFALARSSGELRLEGTLDYERKNSYTLPLRVNYRQVYTLYDLVVEITDIYEPLQVIEQVTLEPVAVAASDTVLVDLSTMVQRQAGEALTYSILSGNEQGLFAINASGQLHLTTSMPSSFAHSTSSGIELRIQVASASGQIVFPLRLVPASAVYFVDQNQIALDQALSWSAQENQPAGTQLGQVYTRLTQPANTEVVYALDHPLFVIDARTGVVRSTAPLNFEQATNTYELQIQAQAGSLNAELSVRVSVSDANDLPAPPQPTTPLNAGDNLCQSAEETASLSHEVNEDITPPVELLTLSATDEDGDTLSYILNQLGGTELFALNRETGVLSLIAPLNAEAISCHTLNIAARDEQGIGLSALLIIAVGNTNEPPQWVVPEITVPENSAPQTVLADLSTATDPEGSPLSYQIVSGGDSELFAINAASELVLNAALDYESASTHRIQVRISDLSALSTVFDIDIAVTNINEPPQPDQLPLSFEVVENSPLNTEVGQPTFTDPEDDALTWSIPTANIPITINANNGLLLLSAAVDAESRSEYSFQIRVEDTNGAFALYPATLRISGINEAPVLRSPTTTADTAISFAHSLGVGAIVATLAVSDPENDNLSYSLTSGNEQGLFAIDNTGLVTMAQIVNLDTVGMDYQTALAIQISDGALSVTTTVHLVIAVSTGSAPQLGQTREFSVDENSTVPDTIANLEIEDQGLGPVTVSFSQQQSQSTEAFAISSAGQLTLIQALDHEEAASHRLAVRLTNSRNQSADYLVVVAVNDINEPPQWVVPEITVPEDSAPQTVLADLSTATDPEESPLSYQIVNEGDSELFAINASAELVLNAALDYESASTHRIQVRISDLSGLSTVFDIPIAVTNINEPPQPDQLPLSFEVAENSPVNTEVGQPAFTDPEDDALTWSIPTANIPITVNTNTGLIRLSAAVDAESRSEYSLQIRVEDSDGVFALYPATLRISDINETPVLRSPATTISTAIPFAHSLGVGAIVATLEVSDPEDDNLIYSLVSGNEQGLFAIDNTGSVTMAQIVNLDTVGMDYQTALDIQISDGALSVTTTVHLAIEVSETSAPQLGQAREFSVDENSAVPATIANLEIEDQGLGPVMVSFSGQQSQSTEAFAISSAGQLTLIQALDHEDAASHRLTVRLTNSRNQSANYLVVVAVNDIDEAPVFENPQTTFDIPAEQIIDRVVASFPATDPEEGAITYSIGSGNDDARFSINAQTGVLRLATDFSGQILTADLGILASDTGGNNASLSVSIRIFISSAPAFALAGTTFMIDENGPVNQLLTQLSATDINNDTLSYRLVDSDEAGSNTNADSQALFEVTNDGRIIVTAALNYEAIPSHALTVAVSDGTDETTQDITVAVGDVNDPPVITSGLHNTGSLPENIGLLATVRKFTAFDEDRDRVSWSLISQQDMDGNPIPRAHFSTLSRISNGQLRLKSRLDFERYPSITLTVQVSDGRGGSAQGSFTFRVLDANEAPELLELRRQYGVAENEPIGTVISEDLIAEDPEGDQARVDILLGNEGGQLDFDPMTGRLSTAQMFDYEQNDSHSLLLQAIEVCKDPPLCELELLNTRHQTTVCVLDVNEAPTLSIDNTITVSSQAQVGSIINRSIAARDPEDQTIELRVVSGDGAVFGIDAERGGIELRQTLTADQSYSLEIQACDVPGPAPTVAGPCVRLQRVSPYNPSCSTIQSVQINTTDDDIQPPAVAGDVLISQEEQNFTITWNNPADTDYSHTILRWQDSDGVTTERRFDRAPRSPGASKDNLWAPHLEEPALNFGIGLHRFEMITVDNLGNQSEPVALRVRMVEPVVLPILLANNTPLVDLHIYDAALDGADSIDNYTYTIVAGNDSYTYNPTRTKTETHHRFRIRTVADNNRPGSFAQRCPFGWLCTHKALANYYDPQDMPETISDSVADGRDYTFSRTRPDHVSVRLEHRHYSHDIQITVLPNPRAIELNQQCENFADLSRLDRWLCVNGRELIPEGMSRRPTDAELCALPGNIRTLWGNDRNNYQLVVSADFNDIAEIHKMFAISISGNVDYWQNTPYPLHEVKDGVWIQRIDPVVDTSPASFGRTYLSGPYLLSSGKFEFSSGYLEVRQLADIPLISTTGPFFIIWSRYGLGHDSFNSPPDISIFDEELVNESGARVDLDAATSSLYFLPRSVLGKVGYLEIDFWERWTLGQRGPLWVIHSYPLLKDRRRRTIKHQQRYTIPGNRAWGNKRYFYNLPSTDPFITGLEIDPDSDDGFDAIRFYRRILQESSTTEVPPGLRGSVVNNYASFKDAVSHTAPLTIEWTNFRNRNAGFNAPCHAEFYRNNNGDALRCQTPVRFIQPDEIQWRFDYIRLWKRRDATLPSFLGGGSAPAPAPDPFTCPG